MACFLVSAAEAAAVAAIEKGMEKKEEENKNEVDKDSSTKISLSRKLKWLEGMLVGGAILLMFEHVWHGEVVPWFPFLTAMSNPEDMMEMFHEMATVGVTMAVLVTLVWFGMCKVADYLVSKPVAEMKSNEA